MASRSKALQTLDIWNFQRHKHLSLQLDQITSLVGKSDVGKSSVIRALRWLATNKAPRGQYIHWGADFAKVRLGIDGHSITRSRGKSNLYLLDGQRYEAFGTDVPEDVAKLLNVGEVSFQGQHSEAFWLSLTAGQASRELNTIINLGAIDEALANAGSFVRAARAAETVALTRLDEAKQRAEALAWVPELDKRLAEVEELAGRLYTIQEKGAKGRRLLEDWQTARRQRDVALQAKPCVLRAVSLADRLRATQERLAKGRELLDRYTKAQQDCDRARKERTEAEKQLAQGMAGGCPVCLRPMPEKKTKKKSF